MEATKKVVNPTALPLFSALAILKLQLMDGSDEYAFRRMMSAGRLAFAGMGIRAQFGAFDELDGTVVYHVELLPSLRLHTSGQQSAYFAASVMHVKKTMEHFGAKVSILKAERTPRRIPTPPYPFEAVSEERIKASVRTSD